MARKGAEVLMFLLYFTTLAILLLFNKFMLLSKIVKNSEFAWVMHGLANIAGYSTVFVAGYVVYKYINKTNYLDKSNKTQLTFLLRKCFVGSRLIETTTKASLNIQASRSILQNAVLLLFYFVGLQAFFLTWGVLQEKIMTQNYTNLEESGQFTDSQFLVFVNRILAFIISGIIILCTKQTTHEAPLYKYAFCSLSNILSSWCQYEALKYVSFPHQVLAKSAKIIPVLIMGRIISKIKYEFYEYVTVIILSCGMALFMLDVEDDHRGSNLTTISGLILLCSYLVFDGFTSNWQGDLFRNYGMSPVQMMCFVNMFSFTFTVVSLLQHDSFASSINFILKFPSFMYDCILMALCSAAGQLFIFRTIAAFGPLVFAIITTIRQGLSVLLSCMIYGHQVRPAGMFGITLIFFSVFLRIYCAYRSTTRYKYLRSFKI